MNIGDRFYIMDGRGVTGVLRRLHGDIAQVLDRLHDQRGGYPARTVGATATTSTESTRSMATANPMAGRHP